MLHFAVLFLVMAQPAPPPPPTAPLTVRFTVAPLLGRPGTPPTLAVTMENVGPGNLEESRVLQLKGGYTFEMLNHAYDEWMQLAYYGKLQED